jgi:imidazolonepropionase-like amidohydrolase
MEEHIRQLIKGARVVDCTGRATIENGAILLEDSKIAKVGRASSIHVPEGADVIEHSFPDCTVLPGLVDAHTHLNMPGDGRNIAEIMVEPDDILLLRSASNAQEALDNGVTTLRDNGGRLQTTLSVKDAIDGGVIGGPRLNLCGWPITITGGHCWPMGGEADGVDGVRKATRNVIKEGADYVKVMATGGSTPNTFPFLPSYTPEELRTIADEAHHLGKLVGVHCRCTEGVIRALDAGMDMIIHCTLREPDGSWKFRPDVAERLAKAAVWVNPTLHVVRSIYWALQEQRDILGPDPDLNDMVDAARKDWEAQLENCRKLVEAGVKLVAGGDTGWAHFEFGTFAYEIEAMHQAGMTTMQALISATRDSASSLGLGDLIGTLEPGKEADILVVEGNPLDDLDDLFNVEAVFQGGIMVV